MTMTSHQKLHYSVIAFIVCVVTSSVPQMTVQTFSMIFSIVAMIAFYIVRNQWDKNSFEYGVMKSLIKTFWIWSALYVVGMFVAGILISSFGDMTAINAWTESVVQGGAVPDEESLRKATEEYMSVNMGLIIKMTLLSIAPAQIYAFLKAKKALYRIHHPSDSAPEAVIDHQKT